MIQAKRRHRAKSQRTLPNSWTLPVIFKIRLLQITLSVTIQSDFQGFCHSFQILCHTHSQNSRSGDVAFVTLVRFKRSPARSNSTHISVAKGQRWWGANFINFNFSKAFLWILQSFHMDLFLHANYFVCFNVDCTDESLSMHVALLDMNTKPGFAFPYFMFRLVKQQVNSDPMFPAARLPTNPHHMQNQTFK